MKYAYEVIDDATKAVIASITRSEPIPHLALGESFSLQKASSEEYVPYYIMSVHPLVSIEECETQRISLHVGPTQIRSI